jgi:hypothetical protein
MRKIGWLAIGCGLSVMMTAGRLLWAADVELPVLLTEDFEHGMDRWQTTDPDPTKLVWQIIPGGERERNHVLRVTGISDYKPPHRSPWSIAWLKDIKVTDFELTAHVQSTAPNAGPHRDLVLAWGCQDPDHFYYVHYGAKPDEHACQVFIVDGADRKKITVDQATGTPWTDGWHDVKIVRHVTDGTMAAYFDDMTKPLMTARDKTFTWGQVGIGTFDDNGNFDDIVLRGVRVERPTKDATH